MSDKDDSKVEETVDEELFDGEHATVGDSVVKDE